MTALTATTTAQTAEGLQPHVASLREAADEVRALGADDLAEGLEGTAQAIEDRDITGADVAGSKIAIAVTALQRECGE